MNECLGIEGTVKFYINDWIIGDCDDICNEF